MFRYLIYIIVEYFFKNKTTINSIFVILIVFIKIALTIKLLQTCSKIKLSKHYNFRSKITTLQYRSYIIKLNLY